jgi:hypothetical protein
MIGDGALSCGGQRNRKVEEAPRVASALASASVFAVYTSVYWALRRLWRAPISTPVHASALPTAMAFGSYGLVLIRVRVRANVSIIDLLSGFDFDSVFRFFGFSVYE